MSRSRDSEKNEDMDQRKGSVFALWSEGKCICIMICMTILSRDTQRHTLFHSISISFQSILFFLSCFGGRRGETKQTETCVCFIIKVKFKKIINKGKGMQGHSQPQMRKTTNEPSPKSRNMRDDFDNYYDKKIIKFLNNFNYDYCGIILIEMGSSH